MVLGISADGTLLDPVLIMKGKGTRVSDEEHDAFKKLPKVKILWQEKAWIDSARQLDVVKQMIAPYVKKVNAKLGYAAEFLLALDRGPGHDHEFEYYSCPLVLTR